jgi:midasin
VLLPCLPGAAAPASSRFAPTGHALRLLERLAAAAAAGEAVLLVGETGTGKTAAVQELARLTGNALIVQNLSQQSDSAGMCRRRARARP